MVDGVCIIHLFGEIENLGFGFRRDPLDDVSYTGVDYRTYNILIEI